MQSFIIHGFDNPIWLTLWAVFLCFTLWILFTKKTSTNFIDDDLLQEVYGNSSYLYYVYILLIFMISSLYFIILAWPYSQEQIKETNSGIDIEIVFDLSYSMLAEDVFPNRLSVAKSFFSELTTKLENDRVWLIVFSWKPFQSIPPSYDYNFLSDFIRRIDVDMISKQYQYLQWSAIWDAILLATDILIKHEGDREKLILLITDGEPDGGINPDISIKYASENNVKIYSLWVGTVEGIQLEVYLPNRETPVKKIVSLDDWFLKEIAIKTWWEYISLDQTNAMEQLLIAIEGLEKTELETQTYLKHVSKTGAFLYLLLACFLWAWYIVFFKKIKL